MIPREILKKIRQIELRTNRLVTETLAGVNCGQPKAGNWLNLTIGHVLKLNDFNSEPCNRLAGAVAGLANDATTCADDAAHFADAPAKIADNAAAFAENREEVADDAERFADDRVGLANDVVRFAGDENVCANGADTFADDRDRRADDAARVAGNAVTFATSTASCRSRQIYFSTP